MNQVSRESWKVLGQILLLAVILYAFLVSIQLLGASFKLFGKPLAEKLLEMTSNPLVGLLAGILATTLAQSSSTTTSITVGMVAGGALTIEGAAPLVHGLPGDSAAHRCGRGGQHRAVHSRAGWQPGEQSPP